jgi:phytoene desaturase
MKKVIVIGAGFAGLSAATHLAHAGYKVTVLEKNNATGGRGRLFSEGGFHFDMGPSWYWMPDIFEKYFNFFGKQVSDYYQLIRLNPSYQVFFGKDDAVDIPASMAELENLFETLEAGSSLRLRTFLSQAAYKYRVGIDDFVHKPSLSVTEFLQPKYLGDAIRLQIFESFHKHARKFFNHPQLLQLIEFPILFLGAVPQNTPALYSLMNYADMCLGTWYPMGGMYKIGEAMTKLAEEKGVIFRLNEEVLQIKVEQGKARKVVTAKGEYEAEAVVAGADYHFVETQLLDKQHQSYDEKYWGSRVLAPSSLLFYLGIDKKLQNLRHHNLFFDADFDRHAHEIYTVPDYPTDPLFYVSAPSQTDASVAPEGCENLFVLMPVAVDVEDTEDFREKYYRILMDRLEKHTRQSIREHVVFKRSFAHRDFKSEYHSFKGNAYGLANTLRQTAILKPSLKSRRVQNLYYTGQLTVPGPGVPPSLISGEVAARQLMKEQGLPEDVSRIKTAV